MTSKIEQVIEEMEQYIVEECKPYPLSKSKIIVDRDRIETLISELQMKMPDEIKRYQKVLRNRNAILEDAQNKADAMLEDANANVQKLISDHEIVQLATEDANALISDAQQRAEQIVKAAQQEADELKSSILAYVEESLANLQHLVNNAKDEVGTKMENVFESLHKYAAIIEENKNEIAAMNRVEDEFEEDYIQEPMLEDELQFADLSYE